MGEIKSTLEIIMEKTKDMTMSEEEEKEFKLREVRGKVGGLILKYIDGIIDLDRFKMGLADLEKDKQDMIPRAVMDELIPRIRPGEDNSSILKISEVVGGIDAALFKEALQDINQRLQEKKAEVEKGLSNKMKERGVSGSAVIPNPDADPDWIKYISQKNNEIKERLRLLTRIEVT